MAIFVDQNTRVLVQGLTGSQGRFHGLANLAYGTQVVAGVTPGKGGQFVESIPVFDSVAEGVANTQADASLVVVPSRFACDAIIEACEAGIEFIVCITEGIPVHDEVRLYHRLKNDFANTRLLGPNCPGIICPGKTNIGITAGSIAKEPSAISPNVGIVSRSGTLTYQALFELKNLGVGVSSCVGIGGDPVAGTSFVDCLRAFETDDETDAIIMIGEIGGGAEEEAAAYISENVTKPVVAYVAGVTCPEGKKMGHAGAIVSADGRGSAQAKLKALEHAGVRVGENPTQTTEIMAAVIADIAK